MTVPVVLLILLPPIVFVGVLLGFRHLGRQTKFLAVAEYWVFLPGTSAPTSDDVMKAMMDPAAGSKLGSREAILFSDVRLGVDLVLREKNAYTFRPDVIQHAGPPPSAECLAGLAHAQSMVRMRFVSERPVTDLRHLTFMPNMARAYCRLGGGVAVFDVQQQTAWSAEEFEEMLNRATDLESAEPNVQLTWVGELEGGHFETHGMLRSGMPELASLAAPADQRVILEAVMRQLIEQLWDNHEPGTSIEIDNEYDRFVCELGYLAPYKRSVRVLRLHRTASQ